MPTSPDLAQVETWFQQVIVDAAADDEVLAREAAQARRWVRPTADLSPIERVDIYRGQYLLRMEEALAADFPGLKHFLGEHGFEHFVDRYVQQHPSRGPNLSRLSDQVPEFVQTDDEIRRRTFAADLAKLELTICQVFECPPSPLLPQEAVAAVPEAAWPATRVRFVTAFRLLELQYPVNDYLRAMQQERAPGSTARRRNFLVVWRPRYDMWRLPVSAGEFRLLADLQAGRPLGEALEHATRGRRGLDAQDVFRSFSRWVGEGFFSALE